MSATQFGALVGILLGFVWVVDGFGSMLIAALIGAIGYVVARAVAGDLDIDIQDYISRNRRR